MRKNHPKTDKAKAQFSGRFPTEIKVRCERDLKPRLAAIANRKREDLSAFVRERLWEIVDRDEKAAKATA